MSLSMCEASSARPGAPGHRRALSTAIRPRNRAEINIHSAAALATAAAFAAARLCRTSVYESDEAAAQEAQDAALDARAILLTVPHPYISYNDLNAIQADVTLQTSRAQTS